MFLLCAYGWNLEKKTFLKAFTTNTCPQRVFSLVQTCSLVDDNQLLPWFSRVGQERILSPFLEHLEEHVGIQAVFAKFWWYFSTVLPFFSMSTVLLEPITLEINKINNDCIFLCICELKMSCRKKKVMAF